MVTLYFYGKKHYHDHLKDFIWLFSGTHSGCARLGAMLTPYVAQVLLKSSLYWAVAVYVLLGRVRINI